MNRNRHLSALIELVLVVVACSLLGNKFGYQVGWASGIIGFLIWRRM